MLFGAAAVVHLSSRARIRSPVLLSSLAMLMAFVWFRHDFRAKSDPGSLLAGAAFVPLYLRGVLLFGVVSLLRRAHRVTPSLGASVVCCARRSGA